MKKSIRLTAIVLLFFNALSAFLGGVGMMLDPSGQRMQLPIELLEPSPFSNFLVPGIILFTVNGLFNLYAGILGILKSRSFPLLTLLCGVLLAGWLTVQVIMIQAFSYYFHLTYYIVGIGMIITGLILRKQSRRERP